MHTDFNRRIVMPSPKAANPRSGPRGAGGDKIRVLIADDHVTVTADCIDHWHAAGHDGYRRGCHGREAVDLWRTHRPDVALLDLRMPVLDGVGAIAEITRKTPLCESSC